MIALPAGPFATITADPPWTYSFSTRTTETPGTGWHGGVENHYESMTMQQIADLPVRDIAADDAVLWLWVVNALLPDCLAILPAWGFEYRSTLTWAKTTGMFNPFFGMGYWMRGATEHAILAVRGNPKPLRRDVPTWFSAPPGRHSEKPQRAIEIFETFSPGPRLELFARTERPGWTCWGHEAADSRDPLASLTARAERGEDVDLGLLGLLEEGAA